MGGKMENLYALQEEIHDTEERVTLFIGKWVSTCGNCHQEADYLEPNHQTTFSDAQGCGVAWWCVSSDEVSPWQAASIRPDLTWRQPQEDQLGISFATEAVALSALEVVGPFPHGEQGTTE